MLFPWQSSWDKKKYPQSPSLMPPTIGHVGEGDEWKFQWQYPDAHIVGGRGYPLQQSPVVPGVYPTPADNFNLPDQTPKPSGGNVFANLLGRPETDTDFWDSLKEQLGEAGADYDAADQPFKSLTPVSVPGARHQPVANPSMLTTRGIPTGGSYNPYLGDPAKRKRVR